MDTGVLFSQAGVAKLGIVASQQVGSTVVVERVFQQVEAFKFQSGTVGTDGPQRLIESVAGMHLVIWIAHLVTQTDGFAQIGHCLTLQSPFLGIGTTLFAAHGEQRVTHFVERYGERLTVALVAEVWNDGVEDGKSLLMLLHAQQDGSLLRQTHTQFHLPPVLTFQPYGPLDIAQGSVEMAHREFGLGSSPTIHGDTGTVVDFLGQLKCLEDVFQSLLWLLGIDIDGTNGVERRGDHLLVATGTVHGVALLGIAQGFLVVRLSRGTHGEYAEFVGHLVGHAQLAKHRQRLLAYDDGTVVKLFFIVTATGLIEAHGLLTIDRLLALRLIARCRSNSNGSSKENECEYQFCQVIAWGDTEETLKGTCKR